jgi:glyoxylase-like metal-dependent hydrolase (beta-lactamase superfamily II)
MKNAVSRIAIVIVTLCLTTAGVADELGMPFTVTRLTDNVLVLTEHSPWRSNHVVISSDHGLVVVDPGGSPAIARLLRKAIVEELGQRRIAYVINHHDHWGHSWGNVAFPEALVIGHEDSAQIMEATANFVDARMDRFRPQLEEAMTELAEVDPGSADAQEARERRDQAEWILSGLSEPGFEVRTPDLSFSERLAIDLGNLTLEFYYLGRGHSATDTIVFIPEEQVLLIGCFFFVDEGLPLFGFQPQLDVDQWLEVFDQVLDGDEKVAFVVPGQHALWTPDELRGWRDYISGLWLDVQGSEAEGITLAMTQERLPVPAKTAGMVGLAVDDARLEAYHRANIERFWRQLKENGTALVEQTLNESGLEAAITRYDELRRQPEGEVIFSENEFNALGYRLLFDQQVEAAIAIFELNVEAYPESWNVYDSLGEAHMVRGDRDRAIELYRRSLELNPENGNAVTMLERLGVDP